MHHPILECCLLNPVVSECGRKYVASHQLSLKITGKCCKFVEYSKLILPAVTLSFVFLCDSQAVEL